MRLSQLPTGQFPLTRSLELQTLILNKLVVEDLGCMSVCEWSRRSWKLEEGDEEACGAVTDGLRLMKRGALVRGARRHVGLWLALVVAVRDRKWKEENNQVPSSSSAFTREGRLPPTGLAWASVTLAEPFRRKHCSPWDFADFSPCLSFLSDASYGFQMGKPQN